jgi:hypothetical protein
MNGLKFVYKLIGKEAPQSYMPREGVVDSEGYPNFVEFRPRATYLASM